VLGTLTRPQESERRTVANRWFFSLAWCLVALFLFLVGPTTLVWHRGETVWLGVALFIMTLAPPSYTILLWVRRAEIIPLDRHMMYVPLVIWYAAFSAIQSIMWANFQGRPKWGPYGADKSLANVFVESMLVLFLSGIYLLRFRLSRNGSQEKVTRIALLLFIIVAVSAVLVAVLVPPMPE